MGGQIAMDMVSGRLAGEQCLGNDVGSHEHRRWRRVDVVWWRGCGY